MRRLSATPLGGCAEQEKLMTAEKADLLLVGPPRTHMVEGLSPTLNVHTLAEAADRNALLTALAPRVRALLVSAPAEAIDQTLMARFPRLEIVASFGAAYDHVDAAWAGAHGIIVTNTPDALNEEVADAAVGLLLCTVREFPQAERYLRAGKWVERGYPLSKATLRDRTVGLVGMGGIGRAIAQRLEAFGVPMVYHAETQQTGVSHRHYRNLVDMARDVDTLIVLPPEDGSMPNAIDTDVLDALGPNGILINLAPGTDQQALVAALKEGRILSAGLGAFAGDGRELPRELIAMDNVVAFPHLSSPSAAARMAMEQLVIDNLLAWAAGKPPLTPVTETPWPAKR
jgi:lactate dehydrogenase-like 2-hydroxyacid dehydrogenase